MQRKNRSAWKTVAGGPCAWQVRSVSALEVLEHLREADPKELAMVRDTAESLLSVAQLTSSEDREIAAALEESETQFARGEGIPAAEAWRRLGI